MPFVPNKDREIAEKSSSLHFLNSVDNRNIFRSFCFLPPTLLVTITWEMDMEEHIY